jgi:hypothetical protein
MNVDLFCERFNAFTPKAFHSKAQGQRRSRATLGEKAMRQIYPEGVAPRNWCNAFGVRKSNWISASQGARQAATLGFGM